MQPRHASPASSSRPRGNAQTGDPGGGGLQGLQNFGDKVSRFFFGEEPGRRVGSTSMQKVQIVVNPTPRVFMPDPRGDGSKIGVVGFYFPGHMELVDQLCQFPAGGNFWQERVGKV